MANLVDYIVGVDLGQASDPTALAVVEREERPTGRLVEDESAALHDAWHGLERRRPLVEELASHYRVVHLERLPLGLPYPRVVEAVEHVLFQIPTQRPRSRWGHTMPPRHELSRFERERWHGSAALEPAVPLLAVDATGVGRPVVDMLIAANLPAELVPITITGGTRVTRDGDGYGVPKRDLVAALRLPLDARRLTWAAELPEARTLERELTGFRAKRVSGKA